MQVIVLFGGPSDERHVSVASAQNVLRSVHGDPLAWFWAPDGAVHDVSVRQVLAHEKPFTTDFVPSRPAIFPDIEQALDTLPVDDPVFLLALHGTGGEDGTLQKLLEERGLPFTGSGSEASAAAFDKERAKELVKDRVRIAESRVARNNAELSAIVDDLLSRHERVVLKPLAGGSSRGLYFLDRGETAPRDLAFPYIVEQFIRGRELTVGVIDHGEGPAALPVIEIEIDPNRTFDYEGKYLGQGTREICPANIHGELAREAQRAAVMAHRALGCEGYSRTDLVASEDGVYYLETNTLPGLTTSSLVPQELLVVGISFDEFLRRQLQLALERRNTVPSPS
ncbi:MAG TPA: ATP-grasp domain-containing protein [Thermoanaerobaculia bacterium]|nr:ATP-grasp domain-containing protein [Thermoanaerobaculia bacterium]